jgi:hypothetical protein
VDIKSLWLRERGTDRPVPRLALWPSVEGKESGGDPRIGDCFGSAHDLLMNDGGRGADGFDPAYHDQIVAEAGRAAVADRDLGDRVNPFSGVERGALIDPDGAQHVRAGALHIFEIIGVIDDPGSVGILEIDGQREAMFRPDEAAAIRQVKVVGHHPFMP